MFGFGLLLAAAYFGRYAAGDGQSASVLPLRGESTDTVQWCCTCPLEFAE